MFSCKKFVVIFWGEIVGDVCLALAACLDNNQYFEQQNESNDNEISYPITQVLDLILFLFVNVSFGFSWYLMLGL